MMICHPHHHAVCFLVRLLSCCVFLVVIVENTSLYFLLTRINSKASPQTGVEEQGLSSLPSLPSPTIVIYRTDKMITLRVFAPSLFG